MTSNSHKKAQLYYLCLFSDESELSEVNGGEENLCCNEGECKGFPERNGKFQPCGVSSVCKKKTIVSVIYMIVTFSRQSSMSTNAVLSEKYN